MNIIQSTGELQPQFLEIVQNALDKRNWKEVTTPATADTEFNVIHGLGYIPNGFVVIKQDKATITYQGTTAWTTEKIFLKTNAATVALRMLIF